MCIGAREQIGLGSFQHKGGGNLQYARVMAPLEDLKDNIPIALVAVFSSKQVFSSATILSLSPLQ